MMYEKIDDRAVSQAFQGKVMASIAGNQQLNGYLGNECRDKPLMEVEYDALSQAISELDASVSELLARIAPVCQPGGLADGKDLGTAQSNSPQAAPSEMRSKLLGLRMRVQAISRSIAPIKFRIEI